MQSALSLALGSYALTPLEIATGYAMLANNGFKVTPYLLDKIIDRDGNVIFQASPEVACDPCSGTPETLTLEQRSGDLAVEEQLEKLFSDISQTTANNGKDYSWESIKQSLKTLPLTEFKPAPRAMDPQTAFLIDSMLKDVILRGTGRKAKNLNRADLAGKTGTTNGPRDAWFSGYSPHLAATAWVGFDDSSTIGRNEYGGSAALPIWIDFMASALADKPEIIRPQPNEIVTVKIDPITGKRVTPDQPGIFEYFKTKNLPEAPQGSAEGAKSDQNPLPDDIF